MPRKTHLRWNALASILTLAVLLAVGGRVMAFLQTGAPPEEHPPATAQPAAPAAGQESAAAEHEPAGEGAEHETSALDTVFQWVNFVLIAAGIWYVGKKFGAPLLSQRAQAIREEMDRSARAVAEASERLSQIEGKLEHLDEELRQLRQAALQEAGAERARIEATAQSEADKVVQAAEQEIAAAAKAARRELQQYTAELAVGLAEKRIRETISLDSEKRIFRSFVNDLTGSAERPSGRGPSSAKGSDGGESAGG